MIGASRVSRHFSGFRRDAFELLRQLDENNNRAWFEAHRAEFQTLLVRPALELVSELGPLLRRRVSPGLRAEPRMGGSMLRMQHDARYARGDPFRTHVELWFWEGGGPSRQHAGFFLRLSPDQLVAGAGITVFPADALPRYRGAVDAPQSGRQLCALLHRLEGSGWRMAGPCLRRVPRPYPSDHERGRLLRQLGLRLERCEPLPPAAFGPELCSFLVDGFVRLKPLHRWLLALGVGRWTADVRAASSHAHGGSPAPRRVPGTVSGAAGQDDLR